MSRLSVVPAPPARPPGDQGDDPAGPPIGRPVRAGLLIVAVFFAGFGGWAALAPLSNAASSAGFVTIDLNRKTVQHLEGGIVREILVRDGDRVVQDQVLIRLDDTQVRASWTLLHGQYSALEALEARLRAERDGSEGIEFPPEFEPRPPQSPLDQIARSQETIFQARRRTLAVTVDILQQRVTQLEAQITGGHNQIAAIEVQKRLIGEEREGVKYLLDRNLEHRPRLLALDRQAAQLDGQIAELASQIARSQQAIGETRLQILSAQTTRYDEVVGQLRDAQTQLAELLPRLDAAGDILKRIEIRAPVAGTVINLRLFTVGGVVPPREPMMEIVPRQQDLIIETRIKPGDIDVVKTGLPAQIRLSAFKQRTTPPLPGTVVYLSADSLIDPKTGATYYLAQIRVAEAEIAHVAGVFLYPGMPAEVMIVLGQRTLLQYLLDPLRESLQRAFTEQ